MSGKSFTVKYDVHCAFQNFFGKETVVKNCMSEMHAKAKLHDYCKKKYGTEFTHIIVVVCTEKLTADNVMDRFNDMFGEAFGSKTQCKNSSKDYCKDMMNNIFKTKK
jgi:hypothetical protein